MSDPDQAPTDPSWLRAHQELEALRDRHSPRWSAWRSFLWRVARGQHRLPPDVADDVVQEALVAVDRKLGTIRDPMALRAFMVRVLASKVHDRARSREDSRHDPIDEPSAGGAPALAAVLVAQGPSPEELLCSADWLRRVAAELAQICATRRNATRDLRIVVRVVLEGHKCGEVAVELGLNPQTVYNVVHRVLRTLDSLGDDDDL